MVVAVGDSAREAWAFMPGENFMSEVTGADSRAPAEAGPGQPLPRVVGGVLLQEQDGERFLLDTESGEVYRVNATAARIFSLCRSRATFEGAVQVLVSGLSAPPSDAEVLKDVRGAVQQLQELGLCEPSHAG
jgi:hypothetical protein